MFYVYFFFIFSFLTNSFHRVAHGRWRGAGGDYKIDFLVLAISSLQQHICHIISFQLILAYWLRFYCCFFMACNLKQLIDF